MLRQLTSAELTELEAMWDLEGGWGSYKEDWRTARSDTIQANVNRGKDSKPIKITDMIMNPDVRQQMQHTGADQKSGIQRVREGLRKVAGTDPYEKGKKKRIKKKTVWSNKG